MYSAGQKSRTFYVMTFLWPPPPARGGLTLNMVQCANILSPQGRLEIKSHLNVRNFWPRLYRGKRPSKFIQGENATNRGTLLCLVPQVVALIISLPGHFSSWNLIIKLKLMQLPTLYTFDIGISTGSEIDEDFHDGVEISLGTPVGGLNSVPIIVGNHWQNAVLHLKTSPFKNLCVLHATAPSLTEK